MLKSADIPAVYTEEDPYDVARLRGLVNELKTDWYLESPQRQREAIGNAFRAALTSPQQDLKWNSVVYQDLQDVPHDVDNAQVYEDHIRNKKQTWDSFGQISLDTMHTLADKQMAQYAPHMVQKYQPGIWNNIRNVAGVSPVLDQLRKVALDDVARGADGNYFRNAVLQMQIPGVGPKIASFAWLLLNPDTSKLSTLDVHMMRALKQDNESPANLNDYHSLEKQLDAYKNSIGYQDVPLGMFQWAVWDWQRANGWHQDHSALRPLDPTPWHTIDWTHSSRRYDRQPRPQEVPEGQTALFAKLKLAWTI